MAAFAQKRVIAIVAALLFLGVNVALFRVVGEAEAYPQRRSLGEFPTRVGEWVCPQRIVMTANVFRISEVDDYLLCNYERAAEPAASSRAARPDAVNVYVGYHARQLRSGGTASDGDTNNKEEAAIHPPKHCLPGSGWDIVDATVVEIDPEGLPGGPGQVNRFTIAKGNQRQLVYYWYQSRGRVIASDWQKVALLALDRVVRQRTDGALIRFTTAIESDDMDAADQRVLSMIDAVVPRLPDFLPE